MFGGDLVLMIAAFCLVGGVVLLLGMLLGGKSADAESGLGGYGARRSAANPSRGSRALPQMGAALMPKNKARASRLKARLLQAGLYQRHSTAVYLGIKFVLMVAPMMVGFMLSTAGLMTLKQGIFLGAMIGLVGTVAPGFYLDHVKRQRQKNIRRALPDALDIIVVCLEGGLSLPGALQRVATELKNAHPLLAHEMAIVQREIQLGRTTGEALRQFADRFDATELRSLASVVTQAERFGASVVNALRVHADTLRLKRYQYAEGQAQKAPVKLIFPTVLCIFPALYIVLMGPAGVRVYEMLERF